jgi:hypothetical protein
MRGTRARGHSREQYKICTKKKKIKNQGGGKEYLFKN